MHKTQTDTKQKRRDAETRSGKYRELEQRTTSFLVAVIKLCKQLPRDGINKRLIDQLIRSAGSIGANYREANEALSKKDFVYRVRITRKESKETSHWLTALAEANPSFAGMIDGLRQEAVELRSIFSAILTKVEVK